MVRPDGFGNLRAAEAAYVVGPESAARWRVYLSSSGADVVLPAGWLTRTPEPTPLVYCRTAAGLDGFVEYRNRRLVYLHPDDPRAGRTLLSRAEATAATLARHSDRHGLGKRYWVGVPLGTCYDWRPVAGGSPAHATHAGEA